MIRSFLRRTRFALAGAAVVAATLPAGAQAPAPAPKPATAAAPAQLSEHVRKDAQRHRAMAAAHEGAARCLESGKTEETCQAELKTACKGLALGKHCGMRHEH